jgi:membrane protein implicated in regulation of membrane protease activity
MIFIKTIVYIKNILNLTKAKFIKLLEDESLRGILIRIALFLFIVTASFKLLFSFSTYQSFGSSNEILGLLIKVISVIVAVIVSYLFAKLFSERKERIGRKQEIDILAKKVFRLQRLSYRIRFSHEFWQIRTDYNPKNIIDYNYKKLTLESYRYNDKRPYEEQLKISSEIGSLAGQAYLGLKGLENEEHSFVFIQDFNLKTFSLDELHKFKECAHFFGTFLYKNNSGDACFNRMQTIDKDYIDDLYFKIMDRKINRKQFGTDITDLYSFFSETFLDNLYYLTDLNEARMSKLFYWALQNVVVSLLLLTMSLFLLIIDLNPVTEYVFTLLAVSIFVGNTVDLVTIIYNAVKTELKIDKVYKI